MGATVTLNWGIFRRATQTPVWGENTCIWGRRRKEIGEAAIFLAWVIAWMSKLWIKKGTMEEVAGEEWWKKTELGFENSKLELSVGPYQNFLRSNVWGI